MNTTSLPPTTANHSNATSSTARGRGIFLSALNQQTTAVPPIWLMRQAGRFLPEYRAVREKVGSFMNLCRNAEACAEVAMQPLRHFGLDASIVFSDILTIPDAMGMGLSFAEGEGPVLQWRITNPADLQRLNTADIMERLTYVPQAVAATRQALNDFRDHSGAPVPLIGFAGSPFTLACYMVEGGKMKDFATVKKMVFAEPDCMHQLLALLVDATVPYLVAQRRAGAEVLMIFDSWGGVLPSPQYLEFSLHYAQSIISKVRAELQEQTPFILFSKGAHGNLAAMAQTGATALGIDSTMPLTEAHQQLQAAGVAVQGNFDPQLLALANPETIRHMAHSALASIKTPAGYRGYVCNLGHGIVPPTPIANVHALVDAVRKFS